MVVLVVDVDEVFVDLGILIDVEFSTVSCGKFSVMWEMSGEILLFDTFING